MLHPIGEKCSPTAPKNCNVKRKCLLTKIWGWFWRFHHTKVQRKITPSLSLSTSLPFSKFLFGPKSPCRHLGVITWIKAPLLFNKFIPLETYPLLSRYCSCAMQDNLWFSLRNVWNRWNLCYVFSTLSAYKCWRACTKIESVEFDYGQPTIPFS